MNDQVKEMLIKEAKEHMEYLEATYMEFKDLSAFEKIFLVKLTQIEHMLERIGIQI